MSVSLKHVFTQAPVIASLGRTALGALVGPKAGKPPETPGPWIEAELSPRPARLVHDYIRHVGGDPAAWRGHLPPHLFPQWGFPLAARALEGLPYPLTRVINAGCRIEARAPLPANERLLVKVRLESIDDDGRRALMVQKVITGTASAPEAVVAEMRTFVPLAKGKGKEKAKGKPNGNGRAAARPTVPLEAHELSFFSLDPHAGRDFAVLTGDFNPIHWIPQAARAAGFPNCILHGFATLARAWEALVRVRLAGDTRALSTIDVRFTRPLVLPARVGVYVHDQKVWVGDAPGGGAYLEGSYETRGAR